VANRAHHADVGGTTPGSMPPDATTIDEEGIRLPPTLLTGEVVDRFVGASRTPDEREGDLAAQRGANARGVDRFREVIASAVPRGREREILGELLDYGERRMRAALADLPDGEWHVDDVLDSTGARPDQRAPARIALTLRVLVVRLQRHRPRSGNCRSAGVGRAVSSRLPRADPTYRHGGATAAVPWWHPGTGRRGAPRLSRCWPGTSR
jgi:hypothetical protein